MPMDLWSLYAQMKKSRQFEEAIAELWKDGLISGEMHLGAGEEAIVAGILAHIREGDALALDHRGTPPLLMRGVDPLLILRELLGRSDGLCAGQGGHMHLFSKEHLATSSGIVGASGPAAAGFALAAQQLRPNSIAVAFFGEGAMNAGMLMESLNLAAVWKLPALFVCKDDSWSITTKSSSYTGGSLPERVEGLGVPYAKVDGLDVEAVWRISGQMIEPVRSGRGPAFLHASCVHLEAHFLGDPLLHITQQPLQELPKIARPLLRSLLKSNGGSVRDRWLGMKIILSSVVSTIRDPRNSLANDPLARTRLSMMTEPERLDKLEDEIKQDVNAIVAAAMQEGLA